MGISRNRFWRMFVSTVVLIVLPTQLIASLIDTGRWGWPFITYPMYANAHYEGERLKYDVRAFAVLEDSSRIEIKREQLNMRQRWQFYLFQKHVWFPIRDGDKELLEPLIRKYCDLSNGKLVRLELEDLGIAVTKEGPVSGLKPNVFSPLNVSCD